MDKKVVIVALFTVALTLASCGSSKESAYKKAYEKAKAQEGQGFNSEEYQQPATATVTPYVDTPVQVQPSTPVSVDNVSVRQESVTLVNGSGLKDYSVVVGSFGVKANAEGLQRTLQSRGYDAQIAFNSERNMYRVIASTYSDKVSAVDSRTQLRATYPDAWLLFKK